MGPLAEVCEFEPSSAEIEQVRGVKIVVEEEEIENAAPTPREVAILHSPTLTLSAPKLMVRTKALVIGMGVVALAGIAVLIAYRARIRPSPTGTTPPHSIAVLPLRNLTGDAANDYLSDGITESLIAALSKVEGLKVISPGSVFTYRGRQVDPRQVGRELNVATVLDGSVRKSGETVRVDATLASAEDGRVLWASDSSDRAFGDIFAVQENIARNVAVGLMLSLSGEAFQRLTSRSTENNEAYQAYLKAEYFLNKRSPDGLQQAREYFDQAIKEDPQYALAYAGLSQYYIMAIWFTANTPPLEALEKAKATARKAVEIDDALTEAHIALASADGNDWDLWDSVRESARAIELSPGSSEAHHTHAYALLDVGRTDEAIAEIKKAQQLDPLSIVMSTDVGELLLYARRYDEAIAALKTVFERDPGRQNANWDLGEAYRHKSMFDAAAAEYLQAKALNGESQDTIAALQSAYATSGMQGFWQKELELALEKAKRGYFSSFTIARFYARLGERDRALEWMEKAYREHSPGLLYMLHDPDLDELHSDPRFLDLLRRTGLVS